MQLSCLFLLCCTRNPHCSCIPLPDLHCCILAQNIQPLSCTEGLSHYKTWTPILSIFSYFWKKTENLRFPGVYPGIKFKKTKLKQQNPLRSRASHTCTGWIFRENPGEFGSQQQLGGDRIAGPLHSLPRKGSWYTLIMEIYIPGTQNLSQLGKRIFFILKTPYFFPNNWWSF